MMKRRFVKGTSFVLAMCLLISLLPAISFAAGETVTFAIADAGSFSVGSAIADIPEANGIDFLPEKSAEKSGQTRRYKDSVANKFLYQIETPNLKDGPTEWPASSGTQHQLVFTADLGENPSAGWYQIKFTGGDWYPASDLYIYANDTYVGSFIPKKTVDTYAISDEVTYGAVYLEPDAEGKVEFLIAIAKRGAASADGTGTYGLGRILIHSLSLTYLGAKDDYAYKVSHTMPEELSMGEVLGVDFSAYLDAGDGIARTMNGISSDRTANTDSFKVEIAEGDSLTLTSTVTDGVAEGKLIPVKTGETKLKITATLGGETYEKVHTVNVVEATAPPEPVEVTVDFTDSEITDGVTAQTIKAEGQYTAVDEETGSYGGSYIKLVDVNGEKVLQLAHKRYHNASGLWLASTSAANKTNAQFTIKVPIAAPGYYKIDLSGSEFVGQGSEYYVYADGKYAGYVSFYHESEKVIFSKQLNTLYLEPDDDNTVKIMFATAANPASYWINLLYLKTLKLTPVKDLEAVAFKEFSETLPDKIYIGEPVDFTVSAIMNDGSLRRSNGYTSAAVADDGNYTTATVKDGAATITKTSDDRFSDGVYAGTLAATEPGDIVVTLSTRIDSGDVIERDFTIHAEYPPKLSEVTISLDKTSIPVTRTAKASLTLTRDDGTPLPEDEERTVEYSAAPEGVVALSQDGTITAIGEGTATVTATVTTADTPEGISGTAEITVTAKPTLSEIALSADSNAMVAGAEKQLNVSAMMSDGLSGDISKYNVTYKSSNEGVASVSDTGVVTAKAEGSAVITATAEGENGSVSATLGITVYDEVPTTVIDFTQTVVSSVKDENGKTTYPYSGNSPGYTVTYAGNNSFRKYAYSDSGRQILHVATRGSSRRMWPKYPDETGHTLGIKVNIPIESDYRIVLSGGKWYAGGVYSIFIDGVYAGDHSFWDGNHYEKGKTMLDKYTEDGHELNTLHLTGGEHEIIFRTREADYDTPYLLLNTLSFVPVEGETVLSKIAASLPGELAIGEVFESDAYAEMSDGSAYHFGVTSEGVLDTENTFTATIDGDGAALSGFASYAIGKSGKSSFTLTGVSENLDGVTVNLSATVGGVTKSMAATIPVRDDKIKSTTAKTEAEEMFKGDMSYLVPTVTLESGRVISSSAVTTTYKALTPEIATVDEVTGLVTGLEVGTAKILVTSIFNGKTAEKEIEVEILPEGMTELIVTAGGSEKIRLTDIENDTVPLYVTALSNLGRELDLTGAEISAEIIAGGDYAEFSDGFDILPKAVGDVTFRVRVEMPDGRIRETEKTLSVIKGKSESTYMTDAKAAAAQANVKKYDWAKKEIQTYIDVADESVDKLDLLWDMLVSEGIPRSFSIGGEGDPDMYNCRYCNTDIRLNYGSYAWVHNAFQRPWQVQCPDCKRLFPTNDFESFYQLGLNEYGEFDRMRALEAHREMLLEKGLIDTTVTDPGKEHSKAWRDYYGYGIAGGYLYNEMYSGLEGEKSINAGKGLREGERTETWGVDDSMGYVPAKDDGTPYTYDNGVVERHTYIAEYMHSGVWRRMDNTGGALIRAIQNNACAYFYTGEVKYGRVAAILLDRLADFYPDYDLSIYGDNVWNSDGGSNKGKVVGRIWETGNAGWFVRAYDMVYDLYDDPYVMDYIKNKNKIYKMRHAKETPSQVRTNIEDGIIRTVMEGLRDTSIAGNFGYPQKPNVYAAVVLDSMPETKEWLDYLLAAGWSTAAPCLGGGLDEALLDTIDADGQGNEGSSYNNAWHTSLITINEVLDGYDGYSAANLYNNPKFVQMFYSNIPLISAGYTPQIGDSSSTLGKSQWMGSDVALEGWKNIGDPVFAQLLYLLNGNKSDGLHYEITADNPERLEDEVQAVIDEYGEFEATSAAMTNFGFTALRDGHNFSDAVGATAKDTRRDVWMYFGTNDGHAHNDTLNLGMTAFGLNFMPDLGYPETTGTQPNRLQWVSQSISHNTVTVNEVSHASNAEERGKIKHFDGDGAVKVMDVSAPNVAKNAEEFRRSVVYIKVDDENSYAVDFFRVLGGENHLYSFHASSNEIKSTKGLDFTLVEDENGNYISGSQLDADGNYKGTYVGRDETYIKKTDSEGKVTVRLPVEGETLAADEVELPVEYGPDPNSPEAWSYNTLFPRGYTWLKNVDRDIEPENKVEIDFAIKDFNKAIKDSKGLGLYMTVLNGGNINAGGDMEISIADGLPPQKAENKNIDKLKYVLVKNEGENLDTTFTTVFEPYRSTRYLSSSDELAMTPVDGTPSSSDAARAVKVEHVSGRVDYILWATNSSVTYEVTDGDLTLAFRGFAGVYTVQNGENTMSYLHDGDILCEKTEEGITTTGTPASVEGSVKTFTKTHEESNEIVITPKAAVTEDEAKALAGKLLVVDNGAENRSGTFKIESASLDTNGTDIVLNVGRVTPIRKYVDSFAPEKGYVYMIAEGQSARIPLTAHEDGAPVFDEISGDLSVSAGSSITVNATAQSPVEGMSIVRYDGTTLPRGASLDSATGKLTWKPTSSQVGENHVAITAVDELGREATVHFTITVYGSTTGSSSNSTNDSATDNSGTSTDGAGTSSGGGGGGGGGGTSGGGTTDTTPEGSDAENTDTSDKTDNETESTETAGGASAGSFDDVTADAWYNDAATWMGSRGYMSGTAPGKFSPDIATTRGMLVTILYRISGSPEVTASHGFEDVASGSYYEKAIAWAAENGIVTGHSDTVFAPDELITREQLAAIIYRNEKRLGNDVSHSADLSRFVDGEHVSAWALEAKAWAVGAGVINGTSETTLHPTKTATRAECATILYRIFGNR